MMEAEVAGVSIRQGTPRMCGKPEARREPWDRFFPRLRRERGLADTLISDFVISRTVRGYISVILSYLVCDPLI